VSPRVYRSDCTRSGDDTQAFPGRHRSSVAGLCRQGLTLPASTLDADPLANKTHALELDYDSMGGQIRGKIRRIDPHLRIVWVFIRIVDSRKPLD